ncbi:peptide/nickel transport system ATP-binding protein [Frondihabitans sp. PhB188]|uniref:ABC transporter ATP-binding protein n=1 Tax=Frondihabitans sp. PhB188 TaxID=2485200 RepID=UPI000F498515|nr:ATP-binding cassette domain-containing protein [Frondihabitans sp. PhB188]ROQ39702.1 peptide/nickel transport system ATP-binding protein [Frondihabitans sp. PhB188]
MNAAEFVLEDVAKRFGSERRGHVAVKGLTDRFSNTQSVGIIGESGSGKSTLGRMLCALETATSGSIRFNGEEIADIRASKPKLIQFRRDVQLIGQDTTSSFDPRHSLRESIMYPAMSLTGLSRKEAYEKTDQVVELLGLSPKMADRPSEGVSGGQRQRFAIARALIVEPRILVCDEVVSALDVSVQGGILNFLKTYHRDREAGIIFISHGLPATSFISSELRVMFQGEFVEAGSTRRVVTEPEADYTKKLLAGYRAVPETLEAEVA